MLCLIIFPCLDSKDEEARGGGGVRWGSKKRWELGDETMFFALKLLGTLIFLTSSQKKGRHRERMTKVKSQCVVVCFKVGKFP